MSRLRSTKKSGSQIIKPVFKQIFIRRLLVALAITIILSIISTLGIYNYNNNKAQVEGSMLSAEFVKSMLFKRSLSRAHRINSIQYYASQEPYLYNRGVEIYYDGNLIASSYTPAIYLTVPKKDVQHLLNNNTAISTDERLIEKFINGTPDRFGGESRFKNNFSGTIVEGLTKYSFNKWQQRYNRAGSYLVTGANVNYDLGTFTIEDIYSYYPGLLENGIMHATLYNLPYPGDEAFEGGDEETLEYSVQNGHHTIELFYTDYIYQNGVFDNSGILLYVIYFAILFVTVMSALVQSIIKYNTEKRLYDVYTYRTNITNVLAHDLKTPIMSIASYAENYEANNDSERRDYYVKRIRENAFYMNNLIMNTLKYAKAESEVGIVNKTNIDIKSLVQEIIEGLGEKAKAKELQIDCSSLEQKTIATDRIRFRNTLSCLIENAVKYAPEGSKITVFSSGEVLFSIRNEINEKIDDVEKLKEAYVRGAKERGEQDGTGLGLAIADKEAGNLGYQLEIEASDGYFTATIK